MNHSFRKWIRNLLSFLVLALLSSTPVFSHGIHTDLIRSNGVIILKITYSSGEPFAYEQYEVFPPKDHASNESQSTTVPFQNGFTDALGRIAFIPDRKGTWMVHFYSSDGHGGKQEVHVNDLSDHKIQVERSFFDQFQRAISGAGIILGMVGLISLYLARKQRRIES